MTILRRVGLSMALLLGIIGASVGFAPTAGAAPQEFGWWLGRNGSTHCTIDANHLVCEKYDQNGYRIGFTFDAWLPSYCMGITVIPGDGASKLGRMAFSSGQTGVGCSLSGFTLGHRHDFGSGGLPTENFNWRRMTDVRPGNCPAYGWGHGWQGGASEGIAYSSDLFGIMSDSDQYPRWPRSCSYGNGTAALWMGF